MNRLRKAHRIAWMVLAVVLPVILLGAAAQRQGCCAADAPVQLAPPGNAP